MLEIEKENKKKRELQFYKLLTEDKICKHILTHHLETITPKNKKQSNIEGQFI